MRCGLEQIIHRVYSARDLRSVRNRYGVQLEGWIGRIGRPLWRSSFSCQTGCEFSERTVRKTNATSRHSIVGRRHACPIVSVH